jgi:hypothetical protein
MHGNIQIDDVYLGDDRNGGKLGRVSEIKVPILEALF